MRPTRLFALLLIGVLALLSSYSQAIPASEQKKQIDRGIILPYEPPSLKVIKPPPLPPVAPMVVFHGPRNAKQIALTFDACSTRQPSHYDERVTKVLVDKKVPATIFLGGKWIEDNLDHARYLASLPQFELGNHTFLHPHLTRVDDARLREELAWTQDVLYTVTGRQATLFRAPYGEYDDRVVRFAAAAGMTTIQYDLASGDPDVHITKESLIKYVVHSVRPGSIVVMHINRRGWHTADALPEIIDDLRHKGFTFTTVGELISEKSSGKYQGQP